MWAIRKSRGGKATLKGPNVRKTGKNLALESRLLKL